MILKVWSFFQARNQFLYILKLLDYFHCKSQTASTTGYNYTVMNNVHFLSGLFLHFHMHFGRLDTNRFLSTIDVPPRVPGVSKDDYFSLKSNLEVWCAKIEPKLNNQPRGRRCQHLNFFCLAKQNISTDWEPKNSAEKPVQLASTLSLFFSAAPQFFLTFLSSS